VIICVICGENPKPTLNMKKYDIKTTDEQTLRKWYHLMTLGRALDEKAPAYLLQSLGWSYHAPYAGHDGIQLLSGRFLLLVRTIFFLITGICSLCFLPE